MFIQPIDYILAIWFALVAASTAYVAWDQFRNNPEPVVMKWGFILVTLYLGPFGALLYVLADKEPKPGTHEEFIKPLWKQGLGSSIHCVAGDATGIIVAAVIVALLGLPMWLDLIIEYVAGFAFGLFIFQSLFMKQMMGGSYWENVRRSFLPEFISMNFMMAGMAMVMSFLMMGRDMRAMEPTELVFWGVMSLGVMAGLASCYPSNVWMVARGLKHGLMTKRSEDDPLASEHDGVHSASRSHSDHASEAGASGHEESAAVAPHVGEHADAPPAEDSKSGHEHAHGAAGIPAVARLGRHPLHPMLVTLPIGLFVAALIGDVGYWGSGNSDWATATAWLIAGGLLTGLIASAAGLTDFIGNPEIGALYHARYHLIGNLSLLAVAAVSLGLRIWIGPEQAVLPWGLLASAIVVGLLVFTGWHGGEMVFGHGVGMTPHKHGSSGQTSHTAPRQVPSRRSSVCAARTPARWRADYDVGRDRTAVGGDQ